MSGLKEEILKDEKALFVTPKGEVGVFKGYLSGLPVSGTILEIKGEYRAFNTDRLQDVRELELERCRITWNSGAFAISVADCSERK